MAEEQWTPEQRVAFGRRLARAREAKGLTQPAVGIILDVHKATISAWEHGRNPITVEQLEILSREYEVSVAWLITGKGGEEPMTPAHSPAERALLLAAAFAKLPDVPVDGQDLEAFYNVLWGEIRRRRDRLSALAKTAADDPRHAPKSTPPGGQQKRHGKDRAAS